MQKNVNKEKNKEIPLFWSGTIIGGISFES